MVDRLKQFLERFLEFWNKYTSKQKTIIICVIAAVIFVLAIMIAIFGRTQYTELDQFETTADAAEAKNLLEENGISVKVSGDNSTVISVDKKKLSDARLLLGENGISTTATEDYSWLFDNSMSTTDSERQLKAKLQLQSDMETDIKSMDGVKSCSVTIYIPDSSNTIYKDDKESTVSIILVTTDEFDKDAENKANTIASYAANAIGSSTDNVRIIDQSGTLLYSGTDSSSSAGNANAALAIKEQVEENYAKNLRNLLINSGVYNDAQVGVNLDITLDDTEITTVENYSNDDDDTGPVTVEYTYDAENMEALEDLVGTDANDEITDYNLDDYTTTSGTVAVKQTEYVYSTTTTVTKKNVGEINLTNSSLGLVLSHYVVYDEEEMEDQGLLDGTTFEAFKEENSDPVLVDVDEDVLNLIAMASGIDTSRISVMAYDVPLFYEKEGSVFSFERILQIILASLIVALILFVVFKGMKPVEVVELEPELSVEALLATTKENQTLDDIEFSEKSATKIQIEKFVDENPEAVAALLRNWLNEDWE